MIRLATQHLAGLAAAVTALTPLASLAQAPNGERARAIVERVDAIVESTMREQQVPGMAVAVVRYGDILRARGYGSANLEQRVAVSRETVFQSGSVGKQFTAALVMSLVEDGRLALDDSIRKYLPEAPAAWQPITLRHLLTHTSGIADYDETGKDFDFRKDYTEDGFAQVLFGLPLEFEPGARWNYVNSGYMLLGILIHRATGRFYGDLLDERIFKPARMRTARIISETDIVPDRAAGYRLVDGRIKNQEWVAPSFNTTADGALYLSLDDMLAWNRMLRARGLLKPASWDQIYAPVTLKSGRHYPYGFGWFVDPASGGAHIWHSGSWQGFKTYISRYRGDELAVIALANSADADPSVVVERIAALFDPAWGPPQPTADRDPAVTARLRELLAKSAAGTVNPADFAYAPRGFFPDGAKALQETLRGLGALDALRLLQAGEKGDDRIYDYEAAYATRRLRVSFGLAPDGRISVYEIY